MDPRPTVIAHRGASRAEPENTVAAFAAAHALGACAGMGVNVEIKNLPTEPGFDEDAAVAALVAEVLADNHPSQPILVSSFHPGTLAALRAVDPGVATALLTFNLPDPEAAIASCVAAGHLALNPFVGTVDAALVDACHRSGLLVNVWTVDDPERIAELAALGVDGIVTNVPDVARPIVDAAR